MPENKEIVKQEKAIKGTATIRKKSGFRRFLDIFASDDVEDIKEYVFSDIIIPAIRDNVVKTIKDVTDMIFYGRKRPDSKPSTGPRVSYRSYYDDRDRGTYKDYRDVRPKEPSEVIFETREDAEMALDALSECVDKYGKASIADFYDIAGITGNGYIDNDYGWRDVHSAYIDRVREGYIISLPRSVDLRLR